MTGEQIFELLDKGFSKDEIMALTKADAPEVKEEPEGDNLGDPEGDSIPENEAQASLMKLVEETNATNKELMETLKKLQQNNAKMDKQTEVKKNLSADEVIKSFVQNI